MMGYGYGGMMGYGGGLWQALSLVTWLILIVLGVLAIIWLWKKINK